MDDVRFGRQFRAIRHHLGLRQADVAQRAGVSDSLVSQIECGELGGVSIAVVRRLVAAIGAEYDGLLRWRGGAVDRLLDARHAALVERFIRRLGVDEWESAAEVTYSHYGERGSIDTLSFHRVARVGLVGEIKSEITTIESTGRKLDAKTRLARDHLIEARFGVRPVAVGRLLVLPATDAARRVVDRHGATFEAMLPDRGVAVRRWLRTPAGPLAGILFLADSGGSGVTGRIGPRRRVRRPSSPRPQAG